jgi:DNA-binding NarL/FixJ family response regulator
MNKQLRVMLADDHALVRAGIRSLLDAMPEVEVVGEVSSGLEAVEFARRQLPDLVLLDVALPGLNGLEVTEKLVAEHPGIKVLILSMHASEEYVQRALRAGASGYLLKDASVEELGKSLRTIAAGDVYLSDALSRRVVQDYARRAADALPAPALTPRQREVVRLLAEGHSTKEVAHRLGLSAKTVEAHRAQIAERLGIRDVASLVRYAIRNGLVPPEP